MMRPLCMEHLQSCDHGCKTKADSARITEQLGLPARLATLSRARPTDRAQEHGVRHACKTDSFEQGRFGARITLNSHWSLTCSAESCESSRHRQACTTRERSKGIEHLSTQKPRMETLGSGTQPGARKRTTVANLVVHECPDWRTLPLLVLRSYSGVAGDPVCPWLQCEPGGGAQ